MSHCISDRVLNYMQKIHAEMFIRYHFEWMYERPRTEGDKIEYENFKNKIWNDAFELYKNLRVDMFYGNHNPLAMAASTYYSVLPIHGNPISQADISRSIGIQDNTMRYALRILRIHLSKDPTYKHKPYCVNIKTGRRMGKERCGPTCWHAITVSNDTARSKQLTTKQTVTPGVFSTKEEP